MGPGAYGPLTADVQAGLCGCPQDRLTDGVGRRPLHWRDAQSWCDLQRLRRETACEKEERWGMKQDRFALNESEVAAKVIDGEAIILNLANGLYYSLDRVGSVVWELVGQRRSVEEIAAHLSGSYQVPLDTARDDVQQLVSELQEERLVTAADGEVPAPSPDGVIPRTAEPYQTPRLNKYTDMADLLALDPPMPGLMDGPWSEASENG